MKYVLLFLFIFAVSMGVYHMSKDGRRQLYRELRPMLLLGAISLLAVSAVILIAYFGGHLRVL